LIYRFGGFELEPERRSLRSTKSAQPVALTAKLFDVLVYLIEHRGHLIEKRELLDAVWPNVVVEEANLPQAISMLRRALGEDSREREYIATISGRGYQFVAAVEVVQREAADGAVAKINGGGAAEPDRTGSIAEARSELESSRRAAQGAAAARPPRRRARMVATALTGAGATALAMIGLGTLLGYQYRSVPEPELIRFEIWPPDKTTFAAPAQLAISPDGRTLAFIALEADGEWLLWVRSLDAAVARPLPGTEGAGQPFWSPDSDWIGFFAQGKLKKVQAAGGHPQALADAPDGRRGAWSPDGVIVFKPDLFSGLSRVSASGGEAAVLPLFAQGQGGTHPSFLPDGRRFVYWRGGSVYVGALDSSDAQALFTNPSPAVYADPGFLLFARQGTLFAQRFDAATLALAGDPVRIADSLMPPAYVGNTFSVSRSGVLAYRTLLQEDRQLAWFDRTGRQIELVGAPGDYQGVDLSPDGSRIAVERPDGRGGDIWVLEPRGTTTRLTFDAAQNNSMPIWSPDGTRIVFGSLRNGRWGLYRKASNGTGAEELLVESDVQKGAMAWAPDGDSIVYWVAGNGTADQWLLPLSGDREPTPLLDSRFLDYHAQISPNGKWLAYASNDAGVGLVVYVKPFPSGDGKWQISTSVGVLPRWRADGKEIFYVSAAAPGGKVVAVPVNESGPTIERGTPQELFDSGLSITTWHSYAVSPDGQRFLIPRPVSSFRNDGVPASSPISVVVNWTALLEADRP
jgi:DNA-binding winged helix-turn-helix (wHTH) protein/Tol biopolymer transport system component